MKVRQSWYREIFDEYLGKSLLENKLAEQMADREVRFLVKKLKLSKADKILDVPCGMGRHSIRLAKRGFTVKGLDLSKPYILKARKNVKRSFAKNVSFEIADMKNLKKYRKKFDVVINMFTSIGYFKNDRENLKAIKNLIACLKPGGRVCFQAISGDWVIKNFKPASWCEDERYVRIETRSFDRQKRYITARWFLIDKTEKIYREYVLRNRAYRAEEFLKIMKSCGLKNVKVYGNSDGSNFNRLKSHHPIYMGVKKAIL